MPLQSRAAPALPLISPELAAPALSGSLLRLHTALTQRELWHALRAVARDALSAQSLTLELGPEDTGAPPRIYRHAHPHSPASYRRDDPARAWLTAHPGTLVYRLSDIVPLRELRRSAFYERVMQREGWERQLALVAWRGRAVEGALHFHRTAEQPDFSPREVRLAEGLQPHFQAALLRVLAHEESIFRGEQFASMLEEVPVGLLLLDWELRPLWHNHEGAHACLVWNHGERRAAALNPQRSFRVPAPLAEACAELRAQWTTASGADRATGLKPRVLGDDALGLHAHVVLRTLAANPSLRPAFQVQLDYRRPRGDRNRPLSPGAVALLARLSGREREVAMRVREGLRTAEIAAELRRSPLTIKTQLAAIFTKLEVRTRTRVAALLNR